MAPLFVSSRKPTLTVCLALGLLLAAPAMLQAAPAAQPGEKVRLTIGKDAYQVVLGKPFAVAIDGKRITMRIDVQDSLKFSESGVSFTYPAKLNIEKNDKDEAVVIWTFQGQSAAIMLQRYASDITPESLAEALVANIFEQYDEKDLKQVKVKLKAKDRTLEGTQLRAKTDGLLVMQNLFTFANEEGVFALMVQDARVADAEESSEYKDALRLLGESLVVGKEPEPPVQEIIEEVPEDEAKDKKKASKKKK